MCGIVMTVANKATTYKQLEIFEQLLYADALRGFHSTGAFSRDGWAKSAQQPYDFIQTNKHYKTISDLFKRDTKSNFLVGHNRFATMGEINEINAHPFRAGNITMVHNGTLRNQSLLPDHERFVVDSDNICHSLNKLGTAETISRLSGAFALIWSDSSDGTLHLIRNSERPFYLHQSSDGTTYGASEEEMLRWVLRRNKLSVLSSDGYEIETMIEYIFNSEGELVTRQKHKAYVPTFTATTPKTLAKDYVPTATTTLIPATKTTTTIDTVNSKKKATKNKAANKALTSSKTGLKVGDMVEIVPTAVVNQSNYYIMEGYATDILEDVASFCVNKDELSLFHVYEAKVVNAYYKDGDLRIVVDPKSFNYVRENEYELEDRQYEEDNKDILEDKALQCGWCDDDIPFDHTQEALELEKELGYIICKTCLQSKEQYQRLKEVAEAQI